MSNKITNTGIVDKTYHGRGLIPHRAVTSPVVRGSDGTLWACVASTESNSRIKLYKSVDDGFTWSIVWNGTLDISYSKSTVGSGLNQNGPFISLLVWEDKNFVSVLHSYRTQSILDPDDSESKYRLMPWHINIETGEADPNGGDVGIETEAWQFAIKAIHNSNYGFITYVQGTSLRIGKVAGAAAGDSAIWDDRITYTTLPGQFFNIFDSWTGEDSTVNTVIKQQNTLTNSLQHVLYDSKSETFGASTVVYVSVGKNPMSDICLRRDGDGNLCVIWSEVIGTDVEIAFSISRDNGVSWSTKTVIDPSPGHGSFTDTPTGALAGRSTLIGGIGGFILSYVRTNASGVPKTFVRTLTSDDGGASYTVGDEAEVATSTEDVDTPIAGVRFFEPPASKLLDITDPGLVRVAYQAGQGNSTVHEDTVPVKFGQELLSESAYPSTLDSDNYTYTIDPVSESQILATVTVMPGPASNIDYYAAGVVGPLTSRYKAAFSRAGNEVRILRYDPNPDAQMNDRSAYTEPVEYMSLAVVTPMSYEFPFSQNNETQTEYIERDIRKIHLPPDFWLEREYILNAGNYFKRTIWVMEYGGNTYELSQVVPYLVNNQICHYTANGYVVGPSNNPFARVVLPSET